MWMGAATSKAKCMTEAPLDRIYIRDLLIRCIVGIYPEEREKEQDVVINVTLFANLRAACQSDAIEDTVNYKDIKQRIYGMVRESSCYLIEHLAEKCAEICLADARVARCIVRVDKPGALRYARSVAVEIERTRADHG